MKKKISIKAKIYVGFSALLMLLTMLTVFSIYTLKNIQTTTNTFIPTIAQIKQIQQEMSLLRELEHNLDLYLSIGAKQHKESLKLDMIKLDEFQYGRNLIIFLDRDLNKLLKLDINKSANKYAVICYKRINTLRAEVSLISEKLSSTAKKNSKLNNQQTTELIAEFLVVMVAIIVLCLVVAISLIKSLFQGLNLLSRHINQTASGSKSDLTQEWSATI